MKEVLECGVLDKLLPLLEDAPTVEMVVFLKRIYGNENLTGVRDGWMRVLRSSAVSISNDNGEHEFAMRGMFRFIRQMFSNCSHVPTHISAMTETGLLKAMCENEHNSWDRKSNLLKILFKMQQSEAFPVEYLLQNGVLPALASAARDSVFATSWTTIPNFLHGLVAACSSGSAFAIDKILHSDVLPAVNSEYCSCIFRRTAYQQSQLDCAAFYGYFLSECSDMQILHFATLDAFPALLTLIEIAVTDHVATDTVNSLLTGTNRVLNLAYDISPDYFSSVIENSASTSRILQHFRLATDSTSNYPNLETILQRHYLRPYRPTVRETIEEEYDDEEMYDDEYMGEMYGDDWHPNAFQPVGFASTAVFRDDGRTWLAN